VQTEFRGVTLRGLLLNAYAFDTMGTNFARGHPAHDPVELTMRGTSLTPRRGIHPRNYYRRKVLRNAGLSFPESFAFILHARP
jgi:hypothetical protein